MALINCNECGSEISDKAYDCPKCGAKLRTPKRSVIGKIIKWTFILFNILMLWWIIQAVAIGGDVALESTSDAEAAGAAIGTGIGVMFIAGFWVVGDIILGALTLFTRAKK